MQYPKRRQKSSLFALAQTYLPAKKYKHSQRVRGLHPSQPQQGSRAFDFGEAVELSYRDRADAMSTPLQTSSGGRFFDQGDAIALSSPNEETDSQTIDVTAFAITDEDDEDAVAFSQINDDDDWVADLENDDLDYTVEGFEYAEEEEEEEAAAAFEWDEQPAAMPADTPYSDEAIQAAVVSPEATGEPLKSAQPSTGLEVASELSLDDQEFAADLQSILSGAKTYDASKSQVAPTSAQTPPSVPEPAPNAHPSHDIFDRLSQEKSQARELPNQSAAVGNNAHSIFDRMGSSLSQATSFDLGTVALEQRFDEIERQLDREETHQLAAKTAPGAGQHQAPATALQLDAAELVEDLAFIKQMSHSEPLADTETPAPSAQDVEPSLPETEALSHSEEQAQEASFLPETEALSHSDLPETEALSHSEEQAQEASLSQADTQVAAEGLSHSAAQEDHVEA
ncbi:MAG: hypothetical protein F6J95_020355 [Leptolyngbya sp. SIO1E4]|nr:hypothetical protein [Leptolyngbya sp. SIO1E4]